MKKIYLVFIFLLTQLHADINVFIMAGQSNSSRMDVKMLKNEIGKKFPHSILFKYDKEGSNLHKQWYGNGTMYSKGDGELYKKFQSKWKIFLKELKQKNPQQKINLQGLFWMQGESDGWRKKNSESYYRNLKFFLQDLRITLKRKNLPIIVGRLGNKQTAVPFLKNIRTAQNKIAKLENTAIANLDNISCFDNLHFKGYYKVVAKRFVTAMYQLKDTRKSYRLNCEAGANMLATYDRHRLTTNFKSGTNYKHLKKGECAWHDRILRSNEPRQICQEVKDFKFLKNSRGYSATSAHATYLKKIQIGGNFSVQVFNKDSCLNVVHALR